MNILRVCKYRIFTDSGIRNNSCTRSNSGTPIDEILRRDVNLQFNMFFAAQKILKLYFFFYSWLLLLKRQKTDYLMKIST